MKLLHSQTPHTKINSKWIKDLNVRLDTIKLLGENIGRTLFAINHSSIFLDPPPRVMKLKTKINKWDLLKLKSFCTAKDTIPCLKPTNGILSHHTQDNLQTPDYCSFCPPVFTPPPPWPNLPFPSFPPTSTLVVAPQKQPAWGLHKRRDQPFSAASAKLSSFLRSGGISLTLGPPPTNWGPLLLSLVELSFLP